MFPAYALDMYNFGVGGAHIYVRKIVLAPTQLQCLFRYVARTVKILQLKEVTYNRTD